PAPSARRAPARLAEAHPVSGTWPLPARGGPVKKDYQGGSTPLFYAPERPAARPAPAGAAGGRRVGPTPFAPGPPFGPTARPRLGLPRAPRAAGGAGRPARPSVITSILVHDRGRGPIAGRRRLAPALQAFFPAP